MRAVVLALLSLALVAAPAAADPAPRAAKRAALRAAVAHFGSPDGVRVTSSLRSERSRRWALVTGAKSERRLWAAWVRRRDSGRWAVRVFRTHRFDPSGVPCDITPAFSEPSC
jgi:hypothetical protein